jgi:hypothetical protein
MTNWKTVAEGRGLELPGSDLDRILPSLQGLETAFLTIGESVPAEGDSAVIFEAAEPK